MSRSCSKSEMPLQEERRGAKETKMYKGNLTKSAPIMLEEKPAASVAHSSAQIMKPLRKKKGTRKRRVKSRTCQWRPAKTRLRIRGKRCTLQAFVNKRLPPQRRETCFSNLMQGSPPSKKTADVGWSNSPDSLSTGRGFSRKGNVGHSEQRRGFSSVQENQRLRKPSPVVKRRYHSVSEYQFIYPAKAIFHYTKETVKQQLRSIYLGNAIQKPARAANPRPTQMPSCSWEINGSRRGNLSSTTKCPVGREFLRSIPRSTLTQGLAGLTYKIQRLVLVSNKALAEPENPPPSPTVGRKASQGQGRPASAGAKPSAEAFQRLGGCLARKRGHGWAINQGHSSEVATVDAQNPPGFVSGKEGCKEASSQIYGEEDSKEALEREDAARSTLAATTSSKLPATRTRQAVVIPTVAQYSSSDSENVEASRDACLDATTFPGGAPPCGTFCQLVPGEEEPVETLAGCSPEKRGSVGPFRDTERRKGLDAEMPRSP